MKHAKSKIQKFEDKQNYEENQEIYELQKAQEKMDKFVRKAKYDSKSMKQLLNKADIDKNVIKRRHKDEGEGDPEQMLYL